MSTPLRAFLMLTDGQGGWDVQVHRDLEPLVKAWLDRPATAHAAVVHIGFERSASSTFDEIVRPHAGRVLLTTSARYALPKGFHASPRPVAEHEDGEIHLATTGWGYDASNEVFDALTPVQPSVRAIFMDWLPRFVSAYPDHEPTLAAAGVFDDTTYHDRERHLDRRLRTLLGEHRFAALGGPAAHDPCELARALPAWLTERDVVLLDLTVRLSNVFGANGIVRVGDLRDWTLGRLLRLKNFGRTSARDLQRLLLKAFKNGPPADSGAGEGPEAAEAASADETTLLSALARTLDALPARSADILRRRMGLGTPQQTLAEIGEDYDVTRERIRQIEAKTLKRLLLLESWDDLLAAKLGALLAGRRFPLPLLGVEAVDPWFDGVGVHGRAVAYLLEAINGGRVSILQVDGVDYLALMTPRQWETAISEAKNLLASGADKGWTEEHCKVLVSALLPAESAEFAPLLWTKASQHCLFAGEGPERVLHTYGRGAEQIVSAVLEESPTPLHYSEIAERAARKSGREVDQRRAHNAAAEVAHLMGPGTYGARRHFKLSPSEMDALAQMAEDIVFEGGDRQWHCGEIIDLINERVDGAATVADRYHLDIALKDRGALQRLGRMMWSQPGALSEARRLEVRETIISVLQAAGGPLGTEAIRQRVSEVRGVGQHFQIVASDPLLKIGPARWGLNDRDFTIKRSEQTPLLANTVEALRLRGRGVHLTEIGDLIALNPSVDGEEVFALNVLDDRLSVSLGRYLYLREWGGPRRETLSGAVRAVMMESAGVPVSIENLAERAEARAGRAVPKTFVYGSLQAMGARLVAPSVWQYDVVGNVLDGCEADDSDLADIESEMVPSV